MLANKDELKAPDVKEAINQLQSKSLKLFEAAYKKMAESNSSKQDKPQQEETKKQEEA